MGNYFFERRFGHHVWGETIGDMWMSLVEGILEHGKYSYDEGRKRLDLQRVRIKSNTQMIPDLLINEFGDQGNLASMVELTFGKERMFDFDVVPSFPPGADSYYKRICDGKMVDFVVQRLTTFPESKKAVIVFPNNNDYKAVLAAPNDDYLPCIVSVQFRLVDFIEEDVDIRIPIDGYILCTVLNARSIDAYQKAYGNFWAIVKLSNFVAEQLTEALGMQVSVGSLDGLITDAHVYVECVEDASKTVENWKKQK